jgi:hypothetical protein
MKMREQVIEILNLIGNAKWDAAFYRQWLTDGTFRSLLQKNRELKNKHQGQRCFIVGNGPSLNAMDLTHLRKEITFTVNNLMLNKEVYNTVYTDYHIIIDAIYYNLDADNADDAEVLHLLKSINYADKQPICITGIDGLASFHSNGLDSILNLYYIYHHRYFTKACGRDIDLSKNIPSSQNVIQAAILSAMFMGFKDIYLVGCDMTSIFFSFEANANGEHLPMQNHHAYEKELKKGLKIFRQICDNEFMLYDGARTFTIFKRIKRYAQKRNINIYNATVGGGLDVFERVRYETLFEN